MIFKIISVVFNKFSVSWYVPDNPCTSSFFRIIWGWWMRYKCIVKRRLTLKSQYILGHYVLIRCLMVSTDQADPSCFYFTISWILMERHWFYFFHPLHLVQGLRSLEHWLLQKLSMKILFSTIITLNVMIKKMPLSFSKLKKWSSYDLLYVVSSEALH